MSAIVVPFPATRRRAQIRKTATYMASAAPAVAESHLRMQLDKLENRLRKAGIAAPTIAAERSAYEAAIRAEIWRHVLTPGGAS